MRLSTKGFILVAVPVVCELVSLSSLYILLNRVQEERARAEHSAELMALLTTGLLDHTKRNAVVALNAISPSPQLAQQIDGEFSAAKAKLYHVGQIVSADPDEQKAWHEWIKIGDSIGTNLHKATRLYWDGHKEEASVYLTLTQANYKRISEITESLAAKQERARTESLRKEHRIEEQIRIVLLLTFLFGIVGAFGLAWYFKQSLNRRMDVLINNANLIASGGGPSQKLNGEDELVLLDRTFADVHRSLTMLRERERAILENAADGICSIDKTWRFTDANGALSKMFNLDTGEIVGQRIFALIEIVDVDTVHRVFDDIVSSGATGRLTMRGTRADGSILVMYWSATWSPEQEEFYCVVQDATVKEELEQRKRDFVSMVSHDLRSPITAVKMAYSFLELEQLSDDSKYAIDAAKASIDRLLNLTNNLLDLDKLESGAMPIMPLQQPYRTVVENAVRSLVQVASQRGINLTAQNIPDLAAFFDSERIDQVLINLISNACKFTGAGGSVTVTVAKSGDYIETRIVDNGRGIPADALDNIFEKFRQVSRSDPKNERGTGLGLAICKEIVQAHHGSIGATSDAKNGSCFWFKLPVSDLVYGKKP